MVRTEAGAPAAHDFYAQHRGGGLLTAALNQRVGSWLALGAHRIGLSPAALTVAGLVLGLAGSVSVVVFGSPAGAPALLAWHLAYSFDCADGQLARATGRTSPAGARLDVLCDFAVQVGVAAAVGVTAAAFLPGPLGWLVPVFAGAWLLNLFTSVLAAGPASASLLPSTSPLVRGVKLIRDHSVLITVCGVVVAVVPQWSPWLIGALTLLNGGFLGLSIAQATRQSLQATRQSREV